MYLAARCAASRRGSSIMTLRPLSHSSSSRTSGTRVVLPAPGAAESTTLRDDRNASRNRGRISSMGRGFINPNVEQRTSIIKPLKFIPGNVIGTKGCWSLCAIALATLSDPGASGAHGATSRGGVEGLLSSAQTRTIYPQIPSAIMTVPLRFLCSP